MAKETRVLMDGPLFSPLAVSKLRGAVEEGIEEIAEDGEGILAGFIAKRGFEKSGRFLRSIDSGMLAKRMSPIKPAGLTVTDDWAHQGSGRPTMTWFERGTRGGVRMRKGGWGFRNTAKRLNEMDLEKFFRGKIERVLG